MLMTSEEKKHQIELAFKNLEEERKTTIKHISEDIYKMSRCLSEIQDLSEEGKILREDLLGLLEFESDKLHQIDSLMIEIKKASKCRFDREIKKKEVIQ